MQVLRWSLAVMLASWIVAASGAAQQPTTGGQPGQRAPGVPSAGGSGMMLSTAAFTDGGQIPARYTQVADQMSPPLSWSNAPPKTVSFVLHLHDMEVARNRTTDDQMHWLVWNIPGPERPLGELDGFHSPVG